MPLATRDMCRDAGDAGVTVSRTTLMHHINDHSNNSSSIFSVHRYTKLDVAIVGRWVTFHLPQFLKFSAMYVFQAILPFPGAPFEIHSIGGLAADMEFVQNFAPPDFQAKNFTSSISPNFNSLSKKKHKKRVKMEKFTPLAKILHCRRQ